MELSFIAIDDALELTIGCVVFDALTDEEATEDEEDDEEEESEKDVEMQRQTSKSP